MNKKQSKIIGAAMIEAINSKLSFQDIMKELSEKFGFKYNEKFFQKGLDETAKEYNEGK